jgi:hypothetical protein
MKTRRVFLSLLGVVLTACQAGAWDRDEVRQAIQMAIADAEASLKTSAIAPGTPVSVLPIKGDVSGYVEGLIKNAVTASGRQYVEGKDDPFWGELLKEVAWDEYKADLLDAGTIAKFGKLRATKILIYGSVREASVSGQRVYVELELHASSVETKVHVWGGTFAKRFYLPGALEGLSTIPPQVRDVIRESLLKKGMQSLKEHEAKLKGIQNVAYVPFFGDADSYVTFVMRDLISQSALYPRNLDIGTLGQARTMLRDQPQRADGLLYGAVRDMHQRVKTRSPLSTTYEVVTETQLCIESARTGDILWSASLATTATYTETISWWDWVSQHPKPVGIGVAGLAGLLLVIWIGAAARRNPR